MPNLLIDNPESVEGAHVRAELGDHYVSSVAGSTGVCFRVGGRILPLLFSVDRERVSIAPEFRVWLALLFEPGFSALTLGVRVERYRSKQILKMPTIHWTSRTAPN